MGGIWFHKTVHITGETRCAVIGSSGNSTERVWGALFAPMVMPCLHEAREARADAGGRQVQGVVEHACCTWSGHQADSASARARSSCAPSPRQALPCMQASVVGAVAASRSSIPGAFFVCEK